MFRDQVLGPSLLVILRLCLSAIVQPIPAVVGQVAEPPEKVEPGHHEHGQQEHHHLRMTLGEEKCDPKFTYEEGPLGPSHWPELCTTGKMQAPIDSQQQSDGSVTFTPAVLNMEEEETEFWRVTNSTADTILDLQVLYDGVAQTIQVVGIDGVPVNSQVGPQPGQLFR
jgi:hypothetical protein